MIMIFQNLGMFLRTFTISCYYIFLCILGYPDRERKNTVLRFRKPVSCFSTGTSEYDCLARLLRGPSEILHVKEL